LTSPGSPEPRLLVEKLEERRLSGEALLGLAQDALTRGVAFRFRARGGSMAPFIRDGDVITISPLGIASPNVGDVVAFVHPGSASLVVHRVVARRTEQVLMRGDAARSGYDGLVTPEDLLGRVTRVERGGRRVWLGLGPERLVIATLSRYRWVVSPVGLAGYRFRALRSGLRRKGRELDNP